MDLDARIRRLVYDTVTTCGTPPTTAELVSLLRPDAAPAATAADVRESLTRLAAARIFVLQPTTGEILMAPPFSAVPTPFVVESARLRAYVNCIWDGLGAAITLREPVRVVTACACCGDQMTVDVRDDAAPDAAGLVHFAVPAANWWTDIVFT